MTTILHIAHAVDWQRAEEVGEYRWSSRGLTLDEQGYIHASTTEQVERVAAAIYSGDPEPLVLLSLDEQAIRASGIEVRYEDAGSGELFPHIYGSIVPAWVIGKRAVRVVGNRLEY